MRSNFSHFLINFLLNLKKSSVNIFFVSIFNSFFAISIIAGSTSTAVISAYMKLSSIYFISTKGLPYLKNKIKIVKLHLQKLLRFQIPKFLVSISFVFKIISIIDLTPPN